MATAALPVAGTVRLVATDLDGTLLQPDGEVSARTAAAVARARAAGVHVVPVTGRPPQALWRLAADAGLGPVGICSNGAVRVDLASGMVVDVDHVPGEVAALLVDKVRGIEPGVRFAIDNIDAFAHEPAFFDAAVDWDETVLEVEDLTPLLLEGCVKLIARRPGLSALELMDRLGGALDGHAHITTSGLDWVDIGMTGVSKATALARVCQHLGVAREEVVAVGDNHNDLCMLEWAGTGLAVANAVDEVRGAVAGVLPSNRDDGVAVLLEHLAGAW